MNGDPRDPDLEKLMREYEVGVDEVMDAYRAAEDAYQAAIAATAVPPRIVATNSAR